MYSMSNLENILINQVEHGTGASTARPTIVTLKMLIL